MQRHTEKHRSERIGWLRAAVLGANDGILSTASLVMGIASSGADRHAILTAGIAGLASGAMAMAAGEYVSVSSQSDTEKADLERERKELAAMPEAEHEELKQIYVKRGLSVPLAEQVARELMAKDALQAHARDELGITEITAANPVQAALASAATFAAGAIVPVVVALWAPSGILLWAIGLACLLALVALGMLSAWAGGSSMLKGALRVTFWGALAMAVTSGVGAIFGVAVK